MTQSALMIQGTTSDAGKSTLVAGLCRLLARQGISVAPFKPQNMALNSAVTVDGGEIGRAQALQAAACFLAPHTDMNPVLLKPACDTGAQVIIQGRAIGHQQAQDYHSYKSTAKAAVLESFARLSHQYAKVLVEGAGSPAEINLRENDIANMGFAEAVNCPVILVADIDRGGVFAHLVGTLALLSDSEQDLVQGFVINRFRGDLALLQSGIDWLEEKTGKPVLGVIPYLHDLYLDAEDAISVTQAHAPDRQLKVVVPVLPRISNHTDFDSLRLHPEVNLVFASITRAMPAADLVILPGSKNVRADLAALRNAGWDKSIDRHLRLGGKLLGICGGLQMLGEVIADPDGVEGCEGASPGLGYLPLQTRLAESKQLRNVTGRLTLNDKTVPIKGYEIHCGVTSGPDGHAAPLLLDDAEAPTNSRADGYLGLDGQVFGTYVHGLLDTPDALAEILAWAGLSTDTRIDLNAVRETQLDRLADCLAEHLSPAFIHSLIDSPAELQFDSLPNLPADLQPDLQRNKQHDGS